MRAFSIAAVGLICGAMLGGCANQVWLKPGASQSDFNKDKYDCMQSSMASAPVVVGNTAAWNGGGGNANWNSAGGNANWNGGGGQVHAQDMNARARNQLMSACLQAKGWQLTTVKNQ